MSQRKAQIIVSSDRILAGEKPNRAGEKAAEILRTHDIDVAPPSIVPEGLKPVDDALRTAVDTGTDIVVVIGGTGIGATNLTPEVTERYIKARLYGLETQVLLRGLESSPKAGLSRGIIGMTDHGGGSLIINCASSTGAVADALGVIAPLLADVFRSRGE
ncbi:MULTISPECIES: molybdopterin-binding protein [unclassified Corynebacterium]|uniref:molybdopterin-binding protein n=1 Tax=Corynebacterium TaxID=1716 RepID=UPI002550D00E|nr:MULTISPECIES: molybdopterin-binding protein [unclassified Corynebacterium]MDK8452580.1 molybdopterin-binding protein [Corynebacterium sp. MSK084]MDK8475673.1 molybdopterin-binding protein [Corynebacterium sp. MSK310]MDK8491208.1 molybdopterin-binding protein [Corynebacterium sp. MSK175]MDK8514309.1 molybdopterin-binding protein [Corynebacterium sp. MSK123]MDK8547744.1 molybdopterin-binding protein [Corynebacterium sp. MSK222]